jgi:hypothetical protein
VGLKYNKTMGEQLKQSQTTDNTATTSGFKRYRSNSKEPMVEDEAKRNIPLYTLNVSKNYEKKGS